MKNNMNISSEEMMNNLRNTEMFATYTETFQKKDLPLRMNDHAKSHNRLLKFFDCYCGSRES